MRFFGRKPSAEEPPDSDAMVQVKDMIAQVAALNAVFAGSPCWSTTGMRLSEVRLPIDHPEHGADHP